MATIPGPHFARNGDITFMIVNCIFRLNLRTKIWLQTICTPMD